MRQLPCPPLPERLDGPLPALVQSQPPATVSPEQALVLAGVLAAHPQFDGTVVLLGPQTLWAHLSAGELVSVLPSASGALLAALGLTRGTGFAEAAADCLSRPERALRLLTRPDTALGALIGADLAGAKPWWLGRIVLALGPHAADYAEALAAQSVQAHCGDFHAALQAGQAKCAALPSV